MQTRVQKWGNSLALRIPRAFADSINLKDNAPVEISVVDGKLVVALTHAPRPDLQTLLSQITPDNLHTEVETGASVGKETW